MVDGDLFEFTKRAKDIFLIVANSWRVKRIDFLNALEQQTMEAMAKKYDDIGIMFDGGFEDADRKRAIIYPTYMSPEKVDTKVSVFKIEIISETPVAVTHSQVLGSLMSLAIDRGIIGDIKIDKDGAYFSSFSEFDAFIIENFSKVGRNDIRLELIEETVESNQQFENLEIIVSSMRLDVIVKALIQCSRNKADEYLNAGFVRLNHAVDKKPAKTCQIGDILSIRKYGRFKIIENKKTTKSGKSVLVVSKSV